MGLLDASSGAHGGVCLRERKRVFARRQHQVLLFSQLLSVRRWCLSCRASAIFARPTRASLRQARKRSLLRTSRRPVTIRSFIHGATEDCQPKSIRFLKNSSYYSDSQPHRGSEAFLRPLSANGLAAERAR